MICILKFTTSKLLNITYSTIIVGNFFELPTQLFEGISHIELA